MLKKNVEVSFYEDIDNNMPMSIGIFEKETKTENIKKKKCYKNI